jgi:hypothetical protein
VPIDSADATAWKMSVKMQLPICIKVETRYAFQVFFDCCTARPWYRRSYRKTFQRAFPRGRLADAKRIMCIYKVTRVTAIRAWRRLDGGGASCPFQSELIFASWPT